MLHDIGISLFKTHIIPLILLAISAIMALANPHKAEIIKQNIEIHQKAAIEKGIK